MLLRTEKLTRRVQTPAGELTILHDVDVCIGQAEQVAIVGRSGSGKSTLLGLLAGLDQATSGEIWLDQHPLHQLDEDARAKLRQQYVGFVFQSFQLLSELSALDNVLLPLSIQPNFSRKHYAQARTRAQALLDQVGLAARMHLPPKVLSGGEQQRIAIARALITQPKIVFADEPTGNLDGETADQIERLLLNLNRQHNSTLVIVTHDQGLAARCARQIRLDQGRVMSKEMP